MMKIDKDYFKNPALQQIIDSVKLIIFDVNGLIIDDEPVQLEAVNLALSSMNYKSIDKIYWINNCVGHRADSYFKELIINNIKTKSVNNPEKLKKIISNLTYYKNKYYAKILKTKIFDIVRPGFKDFIEYLISKKMESTLKLAIATSAIKNEAEAIIGREGLNIKDYFDYIITGSEIKNSKPDPEIYNKIIQMAKVKPDEGLVFEDSETGVEAAYNAGLKVIAVPNDFTKNQNFEKALYIISDFTKDSTII